MLPKLLAMVNPAAADADDRETVCEKHLGHDYAVGAEASRERSAGLAVRALL